MTTNTSENEQGLRQIIDLTRGISIVILLIHFYFYCYVAFHEWHLTLPIVDRIFINIQRTGLFSAFIKTNLAVGITVYFGSQLIFLISSLPATILAVTYMTLTIIGYILVLTGGALLSRVIRSGLSDEVFNDENETFPQEERLLQNDYSINLATLYRHHGERQGWINIINGRRGVLIAGSPGSGKTWFIVEPTLRALSEKHFAQFIYDYKYPHLTLLAYQHYLRNRHNYPAEPGFYYVDFSNPSFSHRCNPLNPDLLRTPLDAIGAAKSILLAINRTWAAKQGEFFVESPINLLAAVIWFLRRYKEGQFCTLPHAIELLQLPNDNLFTVLNTEPEISALVSPFIDAYRDDVMETLVGQISSVKIPLARLSSPQLYYTLTGSDFTLDVNDPIRPKIVCLGNDPIRSEALSPVISLFCDQLNKVINQKDRMKCAVVYDEFATIRATSVQTVIQVGRSNDIMPIIVIQDYSQLKQTYIREEAEALFNMAGNIICGQVNGETARLVADRFPRIRQPRTSLSTNSQDVSISESRQLDPSVPASTISNLSSGEFVGIVADDPAVPIALKAFHGRIIHDRDAAARERRSLVPLPEVRKVDEATITANHQQIYRDVRDIYDDLMQILLNDPAKRHLIINKSGS
jgi:YWFCY protein/Type IV secretory system Conjugative DNA transfer